MNDAIECRDLFQAYESFVVHFATKIRVTAQIFVTEVVLDLLTQCIDGVVVCTLLLLLLLLLLLFVAVVVEVVVAITVSSVIEPPPRTPCPLPIPVMLLLVLLVLLVLLLLVLLLHMCRSLWLLLQVMRIIISPSITRHLHLVWMTLHYCVVVHVSIAWTHAHIHGIAHRVHRHVVVWHGLQWHEVLHRFGGVHHGHGGGVVRISAGSRKTPHHHHFHRHMAVVVIVVAVDGSIVDVVAGRYHRRTAYPHPSVHERRWYHGIAHHRIPHLSRHSHHGHTMARHGHRHWHHTIALHHVHRVMIPPRHHRHSLFRGDHQHLLMSLWMLMSLLVMMLLLLLLLQLLPAVGLRRWIGRFVHAVIPVVMSLPALTPTTTATRSLSFLFLDGRDGTRLIGLTTEAVGVGVRESVLRGSV